MKRGLPPEAEHEVMEATRRVLGDEGFNGLALERVADRVDVGEPVYDYYDSPAEIAAAFIDYERDRFEEFLMVTPDDPALQLRAVLDVLVGLVDVEDDELIPAYLEMYATASEDERLRESLLEFDAAILDALTETIREGIEDGTFERVDPEAAATMIFVTHMGTLLRKSVEADTAEIRDALDVFVLSAFRN